MPILDGFQMASQLREDPATSHIPVLMLTAQDHKLPVNDLEKKISCTCYPNLLAAKKSCYRSPSIWHRTRFTSSPANNGNPDICPIIRHGTKSA